MTEYCMKLYSAYLNPFQPFPERVTWYGEQQLLYKADKTDKPIKTAIENNLSRAVFSALANAEHPSTLALFLEGLLKNSQSNQLTSKIKNVIEALSHPTIKEEIAIGLQLAPSKKLISDFETVPRLLVGISSSTQNIWTHDTRPAPKTPLPDAWIYIPQTMLLIFECKNDESPLDATQISAYAHHFGLLKAEQGVPNAEPGQCLANAQDAQKVQMACQDIVLDASWSTVVKSLLNIVNSQATGREKWLCEQAATYLKYHIYQSYEGLGTVLDWLNGPNTLDRRQHLVKLVNQLGKELEGSGITFAKKEGKEEWDIGTSGASDTVYVKLQGQGGTLSLDWLDKKVNPVLWFYLDNIFPEIGMEYYTQASGSHPYRLNADAWNRARKNHLNYANQLEELMRKWIKNNPFPNSFISISSVQFRGKKTNWQNGGVTDFNGLLSGRLTPQEALDFLIQHREELWCFPEVSPSATEGEIKAAAKKVRKPALSLELPLDIEKFRRAKDVKAIQKLLREAFQNIQV